MMIYEIRPVRQQDLPEVLLLMAEHAVYEQAGFSSEDKSERLARALFGEPARLFCLVVVVGGVLAGYVSYTFDYSTWDAAEFLYMDCLFLREHARGGGIGAAIMVRLEVIARDRGCVNIQWQTPAFNEAAIRFYERIGAVKKEKIRFSHNQTAVLLQS